PISGNQLAIDNPEVGAPFIGQLDDLRIYDRPIEESEAATLVIEEPVRAVLFSSPSQRSAENRETLREHFLSKDAPQQLRRAYSEYQPLLRKRAALDRTIPSVMVMAEMEKPRETYILRRGDYRNKGEKVTPGVPLAISPWPADAPANRLGLAHWLLSPDN